VIDRMPPLNPADMNDAQKHAAAAMVAGPRKGVTGPFIALLRSPDLMDRMGRVGEYLRFESAIPTKLNELAMLVVARYVMNQFEWVLHYPLALKAGVSKDTLELLAAGRPPPAAQQDEALVHALVMELLATHFVSDALYGRALERFGERGIVDLVGMVGYFFTVCLVMNTAQTPTPPGDVPLLEPLG
jgi:4-carboxymuconolactone decarboxylase